MSVSLSYIILTVESLETCRAFYRDVVGLGNPVVDSNFRCEFALSGNLRFVLTRSDRKDEQVAGHRNAAFCLAPDNASATEDRLISYGYTPVEDELHLMNLHTKCFHDPEGNIFYISAGI